MVEVDESREGSLGGKTVEAGPRGELGRISRGLAAIASGIWQDVSKGYGRGIAGTTTPENIGKGVGGGEFGSSG